MSDVNFTLGGTPAPFMSAMEQVKASAKESAEKVTESFGIEGVKSERALHTRFASAFKDITKGGTNSAEAIGGAFENLTEGLRLSMGSMVALLAVSELVKSAYEGYEAAEKMKGALKDALSIDTDVTNQSVEEVAENVKKLKADAEASNLAAMSSLQSGMTTLIQSIEEGKSMMEVTVEDAENYHRLQQEAHDMEDQQSAKEINNANAVLALKAEGHDKEAEALAHEQEMTEKLTEAERKWNQETIDALNKQIELEGELSAKQASDAEQAKVRRVEDVEKEVGSELDRQREIGMTDKQKLEVAHQKTQDASTALTGADPKTTDPLEIAKMELEYNRAKTAEMEQQANINKKNLEMFLKGNEKDAEERKKQEETAARKLSLLKDQREAQVALNNAAVDATLFHGEASSLARSGLGGRVSGPNNGNASQLKASQEAAKHLAEIKASIAKLSGSIGVAN